MLYFDIKLVNIVVFFCKYTVEEQLCTFRSVIFEDNDMLFIILPFEKNRNGFRKKKTIYV